MSQLRHLQVPAIGESDQSEMEVALDYLQYLYGQQEVARRFIPTGKGFLPLEQADLDHLEPTSKLRARMPSLKSRFYWSAWREIVHRRPREGAIVVLQQTATIENEPVDLWMHGARLALVYDQAQNAFAVTSLYSTAREPAEFADEIRKIAAADLPFATDAQRALLREALALKKVAEAEDVLQEAVTRLIAYFPGDLIALPARTSTPATDSRGRLLRLAIIAEVPSKAVHRDLRPGHRTDYRLVLDIATGKIIDRTPRISACAGNAFVLDPVTRSGNTAVGPASRCDVLDPYRRRVMLKDLHKTPDSKCSLAGPRVEIEAPNRLGIDPPVELPPLEFKSRTNNFAAVSAYYHCDAMFRMVADFGFNPGVYFRDIQRPVTVVHRSSMEPGASIYDGRAINAQVLDFVQRVDADGGPKPKMVEMRFALADLSDVQSPLGLASDVRWIWHEFCHVLLLAGTEELEFKFAHSAGDALAAIMCDPDSHFTRPRYAQTLRGVTFPFVATPHRRHDRDVGLGWGWQGTLYDPPKPPFKPKWDIRDPAGYYAEQILSTTLFRLYRATGGDAVRPSGSPDRRQRRAAAHYVTYLIVRAIGSLGPAATVPADANVFATALMEADIGTTHFHYDGTRRIGGTLHKVIRWAFEKQGLYHAPSPTPRDAPGNPEPVDIYIEDEAGRHGEYDYAGESGWHAASNAVWVRQAPGGPAVDEKPLLGQKNYVYVALRNRGTSDAADATVEVLTRAGADAVTWDAAAGAWSSLGSSPAVVPARGSVPVQFGPFEWTPRSPGRHAILVRTKASGDRSNIDVGSPLLCATAPTPIAGLVPFDNNLGYREWKLS